MRKFTDELSRISACDTCWMYSNHSGPSLNGRPIVISYALGMIFQMWQKRKSQTMAREMRVRRFSRRRQTGLLLRRRLPRSCTMLGSGVRPRVMKELVEERRPRVVPPPSTPGVRLLALMYVQRKEVVA
jgi:hypothetical protein